MSFKLGEDRLTTGKLVSLATGPNPDLVVTEEAWKKVDGFRDHVKEALKSEQKIYGINTGFGYLSNVSIEKDKLYELQVNLIRSHACGVGESMEPRMVRALLVLRAHTFLKGYSAVTRDCVESILTFLKHDILPVIPVKGSVGASGDLAPLSHLALGLLGEGDVFYENKVQPASCVLDQLGVKPFEPSAKEGLSLINGTQFMTTISSFAIEESKRLVIAADVATGLSLEAIRGTKAAFDARIHAVRPHKGQGVVAENILSLLEGNDEIMSSHTDCDKVQDPYSFRCAPQVQGASRDVLKFAETVIETDLNSVTDNPLVFENGDVISGGNFHGQPVAMAMDFLAIAMSELGSISERRTEKLTNPALSGLPAFITKDSGLNSGFMIPHVVTAALVSENKVLCHPASVDSIPTSADKEDHVSMGPIAARKSREVIKNVAYILAIEMVASCQGIDLLEPLKPSPALKAIYDKLREYSDFMGQDRSLSKDFERITNWILSGGLEQLLNEKNIPLKN